MTDQIKKITTTTTDPLGAQEEITKHRADAGKVFKNPECLGVNSTSAPDPKKGGQQHIYTITTTWREGPAADPATEA